MRHGMLKMAEIALCCAATAALGADRYVRWNNATPQTPYLTWETAATNINDAIAAAAAGDTVWVTNGVYDTGGTVFAGNATNRVYIDKPLTLRSVSGPSNTFIVGRWHVPGSVVLGPAAMRCVYMAVDAALIGFTITNGALEDVSWRYGPGVWCASLNCVISNCVLTGNNASMANNGYGGGAYRGALYNCTLAANSCRYGAGAFQSVLYNCAFIGNSAGYGGGAARESLLYDCVLRANATGGNGGGADMGALYRCELLGNSAGNEGGGAFRATVVDCLVAGNYAGFRGSGLSQCGFVSGTDYGYVSNCLVISNYGVAGEAVNASRVYNCRMTLNTGRGASSSTLYDCEITANSGTWGGGVNGCTLYNCTLINNTNLTSTGGGAYNSTLYNCLVAYNTANYCGGVGGNLMYNCAILNNSAAYHGGAQGTLYNCTVVGNTATVSASYTAGGVRDATLVNSIVYYNSCPYAGVSNYSGTMSASYSCTAPLLSGAGNTDRNPQFVNFAAGNYRPARTSPCFNSGLNMSHMTDPAVLATNAWLGRDVEGGPRIRHGTVDMGAYETRLPRGSFFNAE